MVLLDADVLAEKLKDETFKKIQRMESKPKNTRQTTLGPPHNFNNGALSVLLLHRSRFRTVHSSQNRSVF